MNPLSVVVHCTKLGTAGRSWRAALPRAVCKNFANAEAAINWLSSNKEDIDHGQPITIQDSTTFQHVATYL